MQIGFHQRDVRSFHRHIGTGTHCHAYIRLRQSGRIVDAVAYHRHDFSFRLKRFHHCSFCIWQHLCNKTIHTDLNSDGARCALVIAGQHHDFQPELFKFCDCRFGFRHNRICNCKHADKFFSNRTIHRRLAFACNRFNKRSSARGIDSLFIHHRFAANDY